MAPNTLRIKDLSPLFNPLLISNSSNTKPVKTIVQLIIQAMKISDVIHRVK
jgi:hypothetical protein